MPHEIPCGSRRSSRRASSRWSPPIPVSAADTLTPSPVSVTLDAGTSTDINKTLSLDGLPARADIIVAIDTTGSMGIPIAQAQADASNICSTVKGSIPGARFAAVDFEDYPGMPLGDASDTPYVLLTPGFISDCTAFSAAIGTMTADGGGDGPEAYNRAFFEAYSDAAYSLPVAAGGRDPLASQFLVVLGDATPHSADGFGSCDDAPPDDFGRDAAPGGGDDLTTADTINGLINNDITLLMIRYTTGGVSVLLPCYDAWPRPPAAPRSTTAAPGPSAHSSSPTRSSCRTSADLVVSAGCPIGFSFNPAFPTGMLTGPQVIPFVETITAPTTVGAVLVHAHRGHHAGRADHRGPDRQRRGHSGRPGHARAHAPDGDQRRRRGALRDGARRGRVRQRDAGHHGRILGDADDVPHAVERIGGDRCLGDAEFCYTAALPGSDVISAFADTNGSSVQNGSEPSDTAAKTWTLPSSTAGCKVTYGGRITADNGDKATFGGNAKGTGPVRPGGIPGPRPGRRD